MEIQKKKVDQYSGDNRANFIFFSNHKDAVIKTDNDRRYCIFYTEQQTKADLNRDGLTDPYFFELFNWLAYEDGYEIVTHFLKNYKIKDKLNPATYCNRAPDTSCTTEAIRQSLGNIEQEILEAIESDRLGFRGGWVSTTFLSLLLKDIGASQKCPKQKHRSIMISLGYDYHPNLKDGRVNNPICIENNSIKPRLYIKKGHKDRMLEKNKDISHAYSEAQNSEQQSTGLSIVKM